jgi:hypothetical protein
MEGGRSAWLKAVMAAKKPGMSLGDAMKAAKKTYKKGGAGPGGLAMPPMGGRRRKTAKVGGTAYGFTGGPYTGSDLPDGNSRFPALSDATWKGPSELLGGRRRKHSKKAGRRHRKGGAYAPSTDGHAAQLPYDKPSTAPGTAVGANGTFTQSGSAPAAFGVGGRRRRHTKKAGRRSRHRGGNNTQGAAAVYGAASSEASAAARQAAAARNGFE